MLSNVTLKSYCLTISCHPFLFQGLDVSKVSVPVVGGHAGATIIPLLSQTQPSVEFTKEEIEALTPRIQV